MKQRFQIGDVVVLKDAIEEVYLKRFTGKIMTIKEAEFGDYRFVEDETNTWVPDFYVADKYVYFAPVEDTVLIDFIGG